MCIRDSPNLYRYPATRILIKGNQNFTGDRYALGNLKYPIRSYRPLRFDPAIVVLSRWDVATPNLQDAPESGRGYEGHARRLALEDCVRGNGRAVNDLIQHI